MNGAIAEPPPITIRIPKSVKIIIMGASQNFSRCIINAHKSYKKTILFPTKEQKENIKYQKNRVKWMYDQEVYQKWGKKGVENARSNMQKLADLCKRKDIELTIIIYPWLNTIDKGEKQVEIWTDFTTKNGISLIDLFPVFSQKVRETSLKEVEKNYFLEGDVHWNAAGNRLIAESIKKPFEESIVNKNKLENIEGQE